MSVRSRRRWRSISKADRVIELIESGLYNKRATEAAQRVAERGTSDKQNPFITDAEKCIRQIWYSLTNTPESNPPDTFSLANFLFGSSAEEGYAKVLEFAGAKVLREVRVEIPVGDTVVTGRADFLLVLDGTIVELKTTSSKAMSFLLKTGKQGRDEHRGQLNRYLHAASLGLLAPHLPQEGTESGVLVYVIKDASKGQKSYYAYEVPYDREAAIRSLEYLAMVDDLAKSSRHPPLRPDGYTIKKFPCSYCNWVDLCYNG